MSQSEPTTFVIPIGWSTNIGNAFFAEGIKYAIEQAVPNSYVVLATDQPAYLNLLPGPRYRHQPRNSLLYLAHMRPDYIVLAGSLFTTEFERVWGDSFRALQAAGTKILMIGVGHYDYTPEELDITRRILQEFPPHVIIARDHETHQSFKDLAEFTYDGIDCAYFVPDTYTPIKTDLPPYMIMNFDKAPEPRIETGAKGSLGANGSSGHRHRFNFGDRQWSVEFSKFKMSLSRMSGKGYPFLFGPVGLHGSKQEKVDDLGIIRTDHALNPLMLGRIYSGPNAFSGDLPYSYYNLYAQTDFTLTDRVHAALVTMAYGRPAMLISGSGRAAIIERVGGDGVTERPTHLDMDVLAREKQGMIDFLRTVSW